MSKPTTTFTFNIMYGCCYDWGRCHYGPNIGVKVFSTYSEYMSKEFYHYYIAKCVSFSCNLFMCLQGEYERNDLAGHSQSSIL